jgi:redox-sensitive bicupin YhaK (pirin superfamily)
MEIISYVIEGSLEHRDSLGTGSVIRPGDVQRMSAGTGVTHSEYNGSKTEPVHFLQLWLLPSERGIKPSYEQKAFPDGEKRGRLRVLASPDGRDGSVTIHSDAVLYAGVFEPGETAGLQLKGARHAWAQVVRGDVVVNGRDLCGGDGAAISGEDVVYVEGRGAELLVLDLG